MPQAIQPVIQESSHWLVGEQDSSGGWGERAGSKPNALNTAEVILALLETEPRLDVPILKGTEFLLVHQARDTEDAGAWMRQIPRADNAILEVPDIIRTCFAIQALNRARLDPVGRAAVARGVQWLLGLQLPDGGWGFSRGSSSAYMPTCLALLTLIATCGERACELGPQIRRGFDSLMANFHNGDGSFGRNPELVVPHTIYAVLLLTAAGSCHDLGTFLNQQDLTRLLENAKAWLIANTAKAKKVNEETYCIDPGTGVGNYRFRYMTDALLVQAFKDAAASDAVSAIAETLTDNIDKLKAPEGGFYGDRVSTWATAKILSGLQVAKSMPPALRKRKQNEKITFAMLGANVLMFLGSIYLTVGDKLSAEMLLLVVLFVTSNMLLANKIMGGDFMAIVKQLLHLREPKPA
jgi:prenyltransferase beta subunit